MPGLNDLLDAKSRAALTRKKNGAQWNPYNELKRTWNGRVAAACQEQMLRAVPAAHFRITWIEPDRRRDPDNVSAGGRKLILDGLVKAGILPNDGWRQVKSITERFVVNRDHPGVVVDIIPATLL